MPTNAEQPLPTRVLSFLKTKIAEARAAQKAKEEGETKLERDRLLKLVDQRRKALQLLEPWERGYYPIKITDNYAQLPLEDLRRFIKNADLDAIRKIIAARPKIKALALSMAQPNAMIDYTWSLGYNHGVRHRRLLSDLSVVEKNLYRWSQIAEIYELGSSESVVMALCNRGNGSVYEVTSNGGPSGGQRATIMQEFKIIQRAAIYNIVYQHQFPAELLNKSSEHPIALQILIEINKGAPYQIE